MLGPDLFVREPSNPLIRATDLPFTANTVFNAAALPFGDETLLLLRVEDRRGMSHLTTARSADGIGGWRFPPRPSLVPDPDHHPEEVWGIEDPRVTWLAEREAWVIAYTAYGRRGPLVSLATTTDFLDYARLGPIMPPDDKDAALFPRRFDGRWALIHRPSPQRGPHHMWISYSPDLRHWGDHQLLLAARDGAWWDAGKIGLGPPPLETAEGWLILYHGVHQTASGSLYRAGLALLDLDDPRVVLHRSDEWVFGPAEAYERVGDVVGVVFPCGWIADEADDRLRLYYGAADSTVALATARLSEVLAYITACPRVEARERREPL